MMRYLLLLLFTATLTQLQAAVAIGQVWVAPHKVSSISMAPATSLHVKEQEDEEWEIWEQKIEGFEHEEGTTYLLLVQYATEYGENATMIGTKYSLIEVLWKQSEKDTTSALHLSCWTLAKISTSPNSPVLGKVEGIEVNMEINDKEHRISGQSGCNRYFGPATFYEGKFTTGGAMGSTKMACDESKMAIENNYLKILSTCNRYSVKGSKLYLYNDTGVQLVYSACKAKKKQKMGNR